MSVPPDQLQQMMAMQGGGMQQPPQQSPVPQQAPMQPPPVQPMQDQMESGENELLEQEYLLNSQNIAKGMKEDRLNEIAADLVKRIEEDIRSMDDWVTRNDEYLKLAMQIKEKKNTPWQNAANIKYPLLTIAALQFQARAYPAVVNNKSLVKGKPIGYDPSGEKTERAERVGKHMTYQLMDQINNWDEDMDKLCLILPIIGSVFKKTYWDELEQKIKSDMIFPTEVIINYWASSLDDARRITHKMLMYENTIIERQRDGLFLDVKLDPPQMKGKGGEHDKRHLSRFQNTDSEDVPYCLYECQTYLDLDKDGYKEPYVVVIEPQNKKILRIAPNYIVSDIKKNKKGQIVRIKAKQNFSLFNFLPSPDGGILGMGFGLLLGDMNEVVNSSLNQILDQGSAYTMGGGFISKGVKLGKTGQVKFEPNEWKVVQTSGDDLRKGIVPLPLKEPSGVLFNVLQAVIAGGKEVIAISEISTGKLPGQNTPATTTISAIEEGMKVFTAIIKRIHRSLKKEFQRIFELNSIYLDSKEYFTILDAQGNTQETGEIARADYNIADIDVTVESDPNAASDTLRLMKAQALLELIQTGAVDPTKAGQRILEAMDQPNPQELAPQPQPDPKVQAMQMKGEIDKQKAAQDAQLKQMEAQIKQQEAEMNMRMKEKELEFKEREAMMKIELQELQMQFKQMESAIKIRTTEQESQMKLRQAEDDHMMASRHSEEDHQQKLKQQKEQPKKDGKSN